MLDGLIQSLPIFHYSAHNSFSSIRANLVRSSILMDHIPAGQPEVHLRPFENGLPKQVVLLVCVQPIAGEAEKK